MIELHDLRAGYGGQVAASVDELRLEAGRITAVIGRNGSGKSTLLRAICRIIPHEGMVLVDGQDLARLSHRERARLVAYLPQTLSRPAMSVGTLVGHGRYARMGPLRSLGERDREAIAVAMEECGVSDLRNRMLGEVSGGELQRAYLAMTVAQDTPYLLLDEPAAHLDVTHRLEVHRLVRRLAQEGRGVIMTSHDLVEAFAVADEVCVMKHATIVASGPATCIAAREELLADAMGVCVRRIEGEGLLYPYALESAD